MADEILTGIENGEFTAWYQPQFSAKHHAADRRRGAGALAASVQRPADAGQVPAIAEEINVVQTLDRIVLETAL
jgi:EAL domain-containing protein (putative c-di-GMP-specific phosphodiesterase class I)